MFENLPNDIIIDILKKRRLIKEKERLENQKRLWLIELQHIGSFYWIYDCDEDVRQYFELIKNRELKPYKLIGIN